MTAGYEILEHTADIGIRAYGPTLESCFEQAAWGLAEILGAKAERANGERVTAAASAADLGGLLVDFLNELILVHETREIAFAGIRITRLTEQELEASLDVVPISGETETTGVKAATYHRLEVRQTDGGYEARVYLDV